MAAPATDAAPMRAAVFVRDGGNLVFVSAAFLAYFDLAPHSVTAHTTWQTVLGELSSDSSAPAIASLVRQSIDTIGRTISDMQCDEVTTRPFLLPPLCVVTRTGRVKVPPITQCTNSISLTLRRSAAAWFCGGSP